MADAAYTRVPLRLLFPDISLPADIFILLKGKYVKYLEKETSFSPDQYNRFVSKKVKFVYVEEEHKHNFLKWLKQHKEQIFENDAKKISGKYHELLAPEREVRELTFEVFTDEDLNTDNVGLLFKQTEDLVQKVSNDPRAAAALTSLAKFDGALTAHCSNVAILSVFLGLSLGHSHPLVLHNLYLGGVFHDYGRSQYTAKNFMGSSSGQISVDDEDHPIKGAKKLRESGKFPDQVITIVMQHHECHNGSGYPKGLSGKEIYELARVVAIANHFDHIMQDNGQVFYKERLKKALKTIEYDRGNFDPAIIDKCVDALEILYKDLDKGMHEK